MTAFRCLYQFNQMGLNVFEKVFRGHMAETGVNPTDPVLASPVEGTGGIVAAGQRTSKELAQHVLDSFGEVKLHDQISNVGLWAWLTFVLRDVLFRRESDDTLITGSTCRWFPVAPTNFSDARLHVVRMPVVLLERFGRSADHLLCGPPSEVSRTRHVLTRSQGMMNIVFQSVARSLYFNDLSGKLKSDVSVLNGGGTVYRLAQVFKQLDVTWEIEDLEPEGFMKILPKEFDRFK